MRRELSAGADLETSLEVESTRARYEVRTSNPLYQERLETHGVLPPRFEPVSS